MRRLPQFALVIIGDNYNPRLREGSNDLTGRHNAVDILHHDVHQNLVGSQLIVGGKRLRAVHAFADDFGDAGKRHFDHFAHRLTVIDD